MTKVDVGFTLERLREIIPEGNDKETVTVSPLEQLGSFGEMEHVLRTAFAFNEAWGVRVMVS
jgi:hypothetical protein